MPATMKHYRVIAMYDYPEINRSVQISAKDPHQAILRAVLDRQLAVAYSRDRDGNLHPLFWHPKMAGKTRWPRLTRYNRLTWEGPHHRGSLRFDVEAAD